MGIQYSSPAMETGGQSRSWERIFENDNALSGIRNECLVGTWLIYKVRMGTSNYWKEEGLLVLGRQKGLLFP